jgi:hypothetical protein
MDPSRRRLASTIPAGPEESVGDPPDPFAGPDIPTLLPPFDLEELACAQMEHEHARAAPSDRPTEPGLDPAQSESRLRPSIALGSLAQVPRLAMPLHELRSRPLNHQAAFLLSLVDGVATLEELLDVCAMPRIDAMCLLAELVAVGLLRLLDPPLRKRSR